jgi:PKD repeat protein
MVNSTGLKGQAMLPRLRHDEPPLPDRARVGSAVVAGVGAPGLIWSGTVTAWWQELSFGFRVALSTAAIMLVIGAAVSAAVRAALASGSSRRFSVSELIRSGDLAIPGAPNSIPVSVIAVSLAVVGWTGVTMMGVGLVTGLSDTTTPQLSTLRVSPAELSFGGVVTGTTATAQLLLTNTGTAEGDAIAIERVAVTGADASAFAVVTSPDDEVDAGEDAVIRVTFAPDTIGSKSADLRVEHSGSNSPTIVRLDGRGARVIRVNAGGSNLNDSTAWTDDETFLDSESTLAIDGLVSPPSPSHPSIPAGTPADLFQSARISEATSLDYVFPTGPGSYEVRLYFAVLPDDMESPLLDVSVNGEDVARLFDVRRLAGEGGAIMLPIVVEPRIDTISVRIQTLLGSPWVNGIEVIDVSQSTGAQFEAPGELDIGPVHVLTSGSEDLIIRNGGDPLVDPTVLVTIPEPDGSSEFAFGRIDTAAIGHGNAIALPIHLNPSSTGSREAVLEIEHNGIATPHAVRVTGFGWQEHDDTAETMEEEPVVIPVLSNDGDGAGTFLTVSDVEPPQNGVATTDGVAVTYQPRPDFAGEDAFTYKVIDSRGAVAEASVTVSVLPVNDPPVVNANGPYLGAVGVPVAFSSAGSDDVDGTIVRYAWTFGDGSSSAAKNPSHAYGGPGTYTVVLTVTDNGGGTATTSTSVRIESGLVVRLVGSGSGSVSSSPGGIACPGDCSQTFTEGTTVTLTAAPDPGSTFTGWSGAACLGVTCTVTVTADRTVTARFFRANQGGG